MLPYSMISLADKAFWGKDNDDQERDFWRYYKNFAEEEPLRFCQTLWVLQKSWVQGQRYRSFEDGRRAKEAYEKALKELTRAHLPRVRVPWGIQSLEKPKSVRWGQRVNAPRGSYPGYIWIMLPNGSMQFYAPKAEDTLVNAENLPELAFSTTDNQQANILLTFVASGPAKAMREVVEAKNVWDHLDDDL